MKIKTTKSTYMKLFTDSHLLKLKIFRYTEFHDANQLIYLLFLLILKLQFIALHKIGKQ
jgi:hypothetical protein